MFALNVEGASPVARRGIVRNEAMRPIPAAWWLCLWLREVWSCVDIGM